MKNVNHTPLPWGIEHTMDHGAVARVADVQGVTVALCYQQPYDTWSGKENARAIAIAVNHYDQLVNTLQNLVDAMGYDIDAMGDHEIEVLEDENHYKTCPLCQARLILKNVKKAQRGYVRAWDNEFPGFSMPAPLVALIEAGVLVDISWHNDSCPHLTMSWTDVQEMHDNNTAIGLWVDEEDPDKRESENSYRYSLVVGYSEQRESILHTNDLNDVLEWIENHNPNLETA